VLRVLHSAEQWSCEKRLDTPKASVHVLPTLQTCFGAKINLKLLFRSWRMHAAWLAMLAAAAWKIKFC
jgi:hypothetical protein